MQHPGFICWLGLPVWLWDGVTRNTSSLCLGRAMPCAMAVFLTGQQGRIGISGLSKQEWELLQ